MDTANYISMSLDFFCIVISCIIFISLHLESERHTKMNRLFRAFVLCNVGILLSDAVAWLMTGNGEAYAYYLIRVANALHYVFGTLILAALTAYMLAYIETRASVSRALIRTILTMCVLSLVLIGISQFTDMYYFIDANNVYHRQDLYWLSQVIPAAVLLINVGVIFFYRGVFRRSVAIFFLLYMILPVIAIFIQAMYYGITLVNIATTLTMMILYIGVQTEQTKNKELEMAENRMAVMLSQIQPHFLFNALNTIETLCYGDSEKAAKMVRDFSSYLRGNLDALQQKGMVGFDHEMAHTQVYLDLEQQRFEDRLHVVYDLETTQFVLPVLTVQPLVENAVRHGIAKKQAGGTVAITTKSTTDGVRIIISDDGVGFDTDALLGQGQGVNGNGKVGLENVRTRLRMQCGGTLEIESAQGAGTVCTIWIPQVGNVVEWGS